MTTLVVQTAGAIVPNANSYLDVTSSDTLATKYGLTTWVSNIGDKSTALFLAGQYLENIYAASFAGAITDKSQPMSYPRTDFYKPSGKLVLEGSIPEELTLAQLKLAIQSIAGNDLYAAPAKTGNLSELTEEVTDGVKRTQKWFSPNLAQSNPNYEIGTILSPILNSSSNRTVRA